MFASHSWPRWGNARIQEVMRTQRDTYANLNNQTLHYANHGVTINEIQNVYKLPPSLLAAMARAQLPRLGGAQQPRRHQPLPGLLGRQPGEHRAAVAQGLGAALRRDDGRLRPDHGEGQRTVRPG